MHRPSSRTYYKPLLSLGTSRDLFCLRASTKIKIKRRKREKRKKRKEKEKKRKKEKEKDKNKKRNNINRWFSRVNNKSRTKLSRDKIVTLGNNNQDKESNQLIKGILTF